jgi:hypothetical protein
MPQPFDCVENALDREHRMLWCFPERVKVIDRTKGLMLGM